MKQGYQKDTTVPQAHIKSVIDLVTTLWQKLPAPLFSQKLLLWNYQIFVILLKLFYSFICYFKIITYLWENLGSRERQNFCRLPPKWLQWQGLGHARTKSLSSSWVFHMDMEGLHRHECNHTLISPAISAGSWSEDEPPRLELALHRECCHRTQGLTGCATRLISGSYTLNLVFVVGRAILYFFQWNLGSR